jgi:hypothetical protein
MKTRATVAAQATTRRDAASKARKILWTYLVTHPGLTAHELARTALGMTGPTSAHIQSGTVRRVLRGMEAAGQVTRQLTVRPGQGDPVSEWHAVPGAFEEVNPSG